jgi:hypothetical protein
MTTNSWTRSLFAEEKRRHLQAAAEYSHFPMPTEHGTTQTARMHIHVPRTRSIQGQIKDRSIDVSFIRAVACIAGQQPWIRSQTICPLVTVHDGYYLVDKYYILPYIKIVGDLLLN